MNFSSLKKNTRAKMESPWTTQPHPLASPKMWFLLDFSIYLPECKYFVVIAYVLADFPPSMCILSLSNFSL